MLRIFACALFLSAALLFAVQPMVGKMVLPKLGGSPAVWNTCMVFFQALLLLGYLYAHILSKFLSVKIQIAVHALLLLGAGLSLPIALPLVLPARPDLSGMPASDTLSIICWLILILGLTAGAPFLIVSASAPLLQSWFARTSHASAKDPYFLYAASNAGSIFGLLAYPALIEPALGISAQGRYWAAGYIGLILCIAAAAACALRNPRPSESHAQIDSLALNAAPKTGSRIRWIILAAVPSSISLGVTQYISTDIASIPLLWVAPLLLYLLSFIFAFSRRDVNTRIWGWILMAASAFAAYLIIFEVRTPLLPVLSLHLLVLFAAAMVCHGMLARERPGTAFLTEYYLLMSLGGLCGGVFNAIIAPVVLPVVFEYQLAIVASVFLALAPTTFQQSGAYFRSTRGMLHAAFAGALLAAFLLVPTKAQNGERAILHTERTFFGVHRVLANKDDAFRWLYHGTTIHGVEARHFLPNIRPAGYYHPTGPIGQILTEDALGARLNSVAVIGLGAGSLALYNEDNCRMDFYEIDPAVVRIARDPALFDYLSPKYTHGTFSFTIGDGRLEIEKAPDQHYGIIVLDAFSSDAIPTHLLTREALAVYRGKLRPDGLIAIHISNVFFNLRPVVARLAADCGLVARFQFDQATEKDQQVEAKSSSMWCVLSAHDADLGPLAKDPRWVVLHAGPEDPLWTDDYSNVLKVLNWK